MNSREAPSPEPAHADRMADVAPTTGAAAGLRDAQLVAARVSADEAAAAAERARLSSEPLPNLADGVEPSVQLWADEVVHAIRQAAMLEESGRGQPGGQFGGTLYLTSRRLVHIGAQTREVDLGAIAEIAVSLERLLLVDLADGSDLAIEVDQPRLLRVQLAAARAAAREQMA
jgi:hypothetical protein